jgi:hypothetical protein
MEMVWQSGGGQGRKRSLKACPPCRTRKKKCYHVDQPRRRALNSEQSELDCEELEETGRERSFSPGRVSEYNPQAVLADLSKPLAERMERIEEPDSSRGHPEVVGGELDLSSPAGRSRRQLIWYKRHKRQAQTPTLSESHRRYLEDEGAFLDLPKTTTEALLPIYIALLDDLTPVVDGSRVVREYSNGQASVYLVRAMCMAVCKARQALPFLRITESGPLLEPCKFSDKVLRGLEAAVKADLEPDRKIKVQILALMHLNNDGVGGTDRASNHLCQAISTAWSLSLHWHVPGIPDQEQCRYLWWALRSLDRLNKPVMGAAPFMIDDSDVALHKPSHAGETYRSQIMAVSLSLGDVMKRATKVYKASSTANTDDANDFPSFAEVIGVIPLGTFLRAHRDYLEIWYHVTAMLSCRYSGPGSIPYARRLASADRILEIIGQGGHESLPPLPLVPYAISMSTTMIYRALRDGQRDPERASKDMGQCCGALDGLSRNWSSAKGVAQLARRLEKILSTRDKRRGRGVDDAGAVIEASARLPSNATPPDQVTSMPLAAMITPPQVLPESASFGQQPSPLWDPTTTYTQLDTAFHDLFDYGVPNVFRDTTSWEFLQVGGEGVGIDSTHVTSSDPDVGVAQSWSQSI